MFFSKRGKKKIVLLCRKDDETLKDVSPPFSLKRTFVCLCELVSDGLCPPEYVLLSAGINQGCHNDGPSLMLHDAPLSPPSASRG